MAAPKPNDSLTKKGASKDALREASLAYAQRKVDATFQGSVLVQDETMPRFSLEEVELGKFLGKGAYGTVSEVRAFDALSRRKNRRQLKKLSRKSTPSQSPEVSEVTETERVQRESREFISKNCVRSNSSDARYAIKKLRADVVNDPGLFIQAITDMAIETRFLTHLQHPNIIKLRATAACDCYSEHYFLVLDRLHDTLHKRIKKWAVAQGRGNNLLKRISDRKGSKAAAQYEERVHVAFDLSAALDYMHLNNIVYRDIKAENIGFDIRGDVKLFDMGLAKELKPHTRSSDGTYKMTAMTGSLVYMSPEVARGDSYNELCDSYSFAILWWEVLALSSAFEGYSAKMMREKVHNGQHRPTIEATWHPAIQTLLRQSWSADWRERYTMAEIKQELRKECVRARGGDDSGLEHMRRRSTFVFEEAEQQ